MTADAASPEQKKAPIGWRQVLRSLGQRKVLVMLLLGFSSGLPFLLTGNTLGFWLREGGADLATIGFLSWIGLAYSLKMLWAPLVDRLDAPILGRLGRRRGWIVLSQLLIGAGLFGMAAVGPDGANLWKLGAFALLAAFASATQDIVVDAWRIESAEDGAEQGLLSAAYQTGYRAAMLATDSLILLLAAGIGWQASYGVAGAVMAVGVVATLMATEPMRHAPTGGMASAPLWTPVGLFDAIVGPLLSFLRTYGALSVLMLLVVMTFRLGDFMIGPMINPFYVDLGLTKEVVGTVRASVGLWASIAGIALGGLASVRLGFRRTLIFGAVLGPFSNLAFSVMALSGPDIGVFTAAIIVDNVATGFAGVALTAYMSSLTSLGYTATQYALLSSLYTVLGKVLKGFSGQMVLGLEPIAGQMGAYALFFAGTAAIGIPVVALCLFLDRAASRQRQT
ncbi:AmpG family muropeptide MFS transporter [Niveispirillum cyanobacteriorum]|uniref:MFS transporter n=1 Tax=Niveispirillum cyanobacteriorum TaxID=1612173 RepID=A0A2K9N8E2_9PROT|nr:MFS transporter [Niveispirillum cyanobacteriorum]AUN29410.1 MFS transporter [Niveispirillum cyanobacteriorum]GGE64340.1 MFS transporter [Niveispirillum cyanobacteriorum]